MDNIVADISRIDIVIEKLDNLINGNIIVILEGDLASGKTTLVKKYLERHNIKSDATSPTFSIQNIYNNNIYHYDLYNKDLNSFISLGLLEEFEKKGIHFVEWGDKRLQTILKDFGFDFIIIKIEKLNNQRRYIIKGQN